jgi:hypothetical protein
MILGRFEATCFLLLGLGSSGHVGPMAERAETDGADFVVLGERGVYEVLVTGEDVYDVLDNGLLGVESMSLSFHQAIVGSEHWAKMAAELEARARKNMATMMFMAKGPEMSKEEAERG